MLCVDDAKQLRFLENLGVEMGLCWFIALGICYGQL